MNFYKKEKIKNLKNNKIKIKSCTATLKQLESCEVEKRGCNGCCYYTK